MNEQRSRRPVFRRLASALALAVLVVMPTMALVPRLDPQGTAQAQPADLTGVWRCDDGGTYYPRQNGGEIFWYGESSPDHPAWSNIAHGVFEGRGQVRMHWVDVPKGSASSGGVLLLQMQGPGQFVALSKTGGFGGLNWTRAY